MSWIISILASSIALAAPVLYGTLGEIYTERAGISNLGLEGVMLVGAISGYAMASATGNLLLAVVATISAGLALGLIYGFLTITLQANQIVSGLAMVIFGSGLSGVVGAPYAGIAPGVTFSKVSIPLLSEIPVLGPILFQQDVFIYALYILVPLSFYYIFKTKHGLRLRALGDDPAALDAAGINVTLLRYLYVMLGTAITAIGGVYISLVYTPFWNENLIAGKGWIAAALVIFASWNPIYAAGGAFLFGLIEVVGLRLQMMGVNVSPYFLSMLPYLCTILVLIFSTGSFSKRRSAAPAMLGKHYDREAR